ncbi:TonB-dependent receptor [Ottowia testudinis]|uniref:TonB-dependent receptor plug domain-containing protein n=1 Tax=Ottowia testudinis TaxID=2816950 RepID=A0A975CGH9_9BURK|nr:TonB-dependent receptor [Ottowia testudinis]QTD45129.1 TonB-dependent receptor plug domain-containing protein [Ottowia testudinis]
MMSNHQGNRRISPKIQRLTPLAACLAALSVPALAQDASLPAVTVTAPRPPEAQASTLGASTLGADELLPRRAAGSDSAALLDGLPGVSLYGAGGISSLPVLRGLADERLRVLIDGMDAMPACPNHMNAPLSLIDPSQIGSVRVFAGITPVSVGGDSIGGTIQVEPAPPEFATADQPYLLKGSAGTFYRSNGAARGGNLSATFATQNISLRYSGAIARARNYTVGGAFKPVAPGTEGGAPLPGDEVGSSAYEARNHALSLALRRGDHQLRLAASLQDVPFEGFPNQRMDLTHNRNAQFSAHYSGQHDWGELQLRAWRQNVRHAMDMGPDRYRYGTGMPMLAKSTTAGAAAQANVLLGERDILRAGLEAQRHSLYDWWPGVGGAMGPNAFWNIDDGKRHKLDAFAEWERRWSPQWTAQIGLRVGRVMTDAGPVQGYNDGMLALWGADAAAFNAQNRRRTDTNLDFTALVRHQPSDTARYEFGYARKARAPSLYQRYAWSTQPMAALMNNFAGDGNGYIGHPNLKPEIAHTLSATGDWRAADKDGWQLQANAYVTQIENYIDARRCTFSQCSAANATAANSFVLLQYANQSARLVGFDVSGRLPLGTSSEWGRFALSGALNLVRGSNRQTGDGLYNLMPLNARLALEQRLGGWTGTVEWQGVAAKTRVSPVRNEMKTAGYGLLHLRGSYQWKATRLDFGVENLLNRLYYPPLGGAYLGQGASMTSAGIPWGTPVPGKGRSFYVALNVAF